MKIWQQKTAAKQENVPFGGVDYNSILEIYSHSLNPFNTKHISLMQAVFDTYYTAILPIILGFKTQGVLHNSLSL